MSTRLKPILLPCVVIAILVFVFISGILVPIYSDEVAINLSHSRFFYDNFLITGLYPQCTSSWLREARWYEYPALVIYSILYPSSTSIFLRSVGVILAFVNFSLLWFLCAKLIRARITQLSVCAFIFSICALGPLPYVMILTRSEQVLLLCIILFISLSLLFPINSSDSKKIKLLKIISFISITSVFYFAHPKAVFFAPCVLAALYFFTYSASFRLRVCSITISCIATIQVVLSLKNRPQCLEAPGIIKVLAEHLNNFSNWDMHFPAFFDRMSHHLYLALERITSRFLFQQSYQSEWLPMNINENLNLPALLVNQFVGSIIIPFFYVCIFLILIMTIRQIIQRKEIKRHILSLGIVFGIVFNAAIYSIDAWSFYTPGLIIPLFLLAVLLIVPDILALLQGKIRYVYFLLVPFYLVAILSMLTLMQTMIPKMYNSARTGEPIISNQKISTPIFMSEATYSTLNSLAQRCEIPIYGANKVAVDGVAYGFLKNIQHPIDILYVAPMGYGMDIKDLGKFLSSEASDGILSRCDYLPSFLLERAIESNGMCCLSRSLLIK